MSYAQRPMGDYKSYGYGPYRGDPGFLSSLWKGIKKVAKPLIGAALGFEVGYTGGKEVATTGQPQPPAGSIGGAVTFPGGTRVSLAGVPRVAGAAMEGGLCPTGYHPRKDKRLPFKCVRNRRMNVGNARALRKSMRRVQGFEKLAKRTIQFTKRVKLRKSCS